MDRVSVSEAEGRPFESGRARQIQKVTTVRIGSLHRSDILHMTERRLPYFPATGKTRQVIATICVLTTALLVSAGLGLAGCASTTQGGAVGAERKQLLLISSQQLEQLAAQSYAKLQADASKKGTLNTDPALTQRVRAIAARIEPHTAVFRRDAA